MQARAVEVEVHLVKGLPGFEIVGLPETAVRESRVRVRAALTNSGFELPARHVVLNLAPADLKKRGATLDLAIAVALLTAAGVCAPNRLESTLLFGELSLGGELRAGRGLLPQLQDALRRGLQAAVVPRAQLEEASFVTGIEVCGAHDLAAVVDWLGGGLELPRASATGPRVAESACADLAEVQGQAAAKRALEIAAAGAHHVLTACWETQRRILSDFSALRRALTRIAAHGARGWCTVRHAHARGTRAAYVAQPNA